MSVTLADLWARVAGTRVARSRCARAWWVLPAVLSLQSCATQGPAPSPAAPDAPAAAAPPAAVVAATAPAPGASAPRPPGAPAVAPAAPPGPLKPFAEVVKDARRSEGLIALWRKDDKVWLELRPEDFDKPFFLSPKLKTGIGVGSFFGGLMSRGDGLVAFRRIHNQVQLIRINSEYVAALGTPEGRAVQAAFSPSLLASTVVLSLPEPERKSVLIDANAIFVADLLGIGGQLQRSFRQGYTFDARNSAITNVRDTPDLLVVEVLSHYATGSIALPTPGAPSGAPTPSVPKSVPDPRSLFLTLHYSIGKLPEHVMATRKADARVGHFNTSVVDFSDDLERSPRRRYVDRWRLEKKDPAAALSDPVKPITFWIDRTVPLKYRGAITAGVLEWNKAFERIGFSNAIVVEVQPENADFDTLDLGRASIRWMTNATPSFGAIGPRHVDPRSGEILDADIGVESLSSRNIRALRSQVLASTAADASGAAGASGASAASGVSAVDLASGLVCDYADQAAEQMSYALDVLDARGEIDPGSPEADAFVQAYLKDTTMHEVGHALGLRHNFRASRAYTAQQLADPAFTAANGITASVMEYAAINLNGPGEARSRYGAPFNTTLGPYDYWAIEYAYKPIAPNDEAAELQRIAARSDEPTLAYGTDEDNFIGLDPESLQFDLGNDVIAFARKRIAIAQDLLARQETRSLKPGEDYAVLRRSVLYAVRDVGRSANVLVRQVGGVRTLRDAPGSGRDPLTPVPVAQQRQALELIMVGLLSADSLKISPSLQRKLGADYLERWDAVRSGEAATGTDFSLTVVVLDLQKKLLETLMSDAVAARLLDSAEKAPSGPQRALRLDELDARLTQAVWSELGAGGDIPPLRRELQRDHVNRLANQLLRPQTQSRADARSLWRVRARSLAAQLNTAARRPGLSEATRAHLQDSADTLNQALAAKLTRQGV
ncbi:MAG: zinc-dependent metalloprotease [Rhizobacter sp.]|nr:zinc-dependent metalloprotease [Rhizobacter sp.]